MFNNKRKRAVVLALIAFFCGATTYVAVDWKRFGGGFLAFFKHKGDPIVASIGGGSSSGAGDHAAPGDSHANSAPLTLTASGSSRRHPSGVGGSGAHKSDDDLFKYGDPAAGGIPAGSFLVAQNDTPSGGGNNGGAGAAPSFAPAAAEIAVSPAAGGDFGGGGGGVTSPAPAPAGSNGGSGDTGVIVKTPSPPAATPPAATTPAPSPAAPAPAPTQSGTSDGNTGDGGGDGGGDPTGGGTPPASPTPPVSAVPEASNAAMMGLGALFLAVAATRKRRNGQA